jgi:hypothetical protein
MATIRVLVVAMTLAALLAACGPAIQQGIGDPADLPVAEAEAAEVREVIAGSPPAASDGHDIDRLPSPFGAYGQPVGTVTGSVLEELAAAVAQAHYIDTGNVVYDLANPDYEVVFLSDGDELVRLGYYVQLGRWGQYEVPGRWMDDRWRLLAMTIELPDGLVDSP